MQKMLSFNTILENLYIILQNDDVIIDQRIIKSNKQSELLVFNLEQILKDNKLSYLDMDCFSTINGPGNFTGIKTSLAVMKGLQISTNKRIIISNLFEIIFNKEKADFFILDLQNSKYYVQDSNFHYFVIFKEKIEEFLQQNKKSYIVTNSLELPLSNNNINNKFEFSMEKWAKYNFYKVQEFQFVNNIEPLYIEEATITKRKK